MAEEKTIYNCWICGTELTDKNSWVLPQRFGGKPTPYCADCQQKFFNWASSNMGYKVATFVSTAIFNMPYLPDLMYEAAKYGKGKGKWLGYITALRANGYHEKNGKHAEFSEGETEITKIFDGRTQTLIVDDEMLEDEEYQSGRITLKKLFGDGPKEEPYTNEEYDLLASTYNALTINRQYRSEQVELAIQKICRWMLLQERCMGKGDYDKAKKLEDMIKAQMEGEQLRKKDEIPDDIVRMDDIVLAVERAGLHIPNKDELLTALANHSFTPQRGYPYTYDAADKMLLDIINATAWNEGRNEIAELHEGLSFADDPYGEFAKEQDEVEKQIYKDLELSYDKPMEGGETEDGKT